MVTANSVIYDDGIIHNNNVENVNSALEELCSYILKYEFVYKKINQYILFWSNLIVMWFLSIAIRLL